MRNALAIDTSVLLSIFKGEPAGERWLESLLAESARASLLVSSAADRAR